MADEITDEEATEALTWALCAEAGGAGRGRCDPEYCVCGDEARGVLKELKASGFKIIRAATT